MLGGAASLLAKDEEGQSKGDGEKPRDDTDTNNESDVEVEEAPEHISTRELFICLQDWFSLSKSPDRGVYNDDGTKKAADNHEGEEDNGADAAGGVSVREAETLSAYISRKGCTDFTASAAGGGGSGEEEGLLASFLDWTSNQPKLRVDLDADSSEGEPEGPPPALLATPAATVGVTNSRSSEVEPTAVPTVVNKADSPPEAGTLPLPTPALEDWHGATVEDKMKATTAESSSAASTIATVGTTDNNTDTNSSRGIEEAEGSEERRVVVVVVKVLVPQKARPGDVLQFGYHVAPANTSSNIGVGIFEEFVATANVPKGARPGGAIEVSIEHSLLDLSAAVAAASSQLTDADAAKGQSSGPPMWFYNNDDETVMLGPEEKLPGGKRSGMGDTKDAVGSNDRGVPSSGSCGRAGIKEKGGALENWEQWQRQIKQQQQQQQQQLKRRNDHMSWRGKKKNSTIDARGIGWARYQAWVESNADEAQRFACYLHCQQRGGGGSHIRVPGRTVSRKWSHTSNSSIDSLSLVSEYPGGAMSCWGDGGGSLDVESLTPPFILTDSDSSISRSNSKPYSSSMTRSEVGTFYGGGSSDGNDTGSSSRAPSMDSRSSSIDRGGNFSRRASDDIDDSNGGGDGGRTNDSFEDNDEEQKAGKWSDIFFAPFFATTANTAVFSPKSSFAVASTDGGGELEKSLLSHVQDLLANPQHLIEGSRVVEEGGSGSGSGDGYISSNNSAGSSHRNSLRNVHRSNSSDAEYDGIANIHMFRTLLEGLPTVEFLGGTISSPESSSPSSLSSSSPHGHDTAEIEFGLNLMHNSQEWDHTFTVDSDENADEKEKQHHEQYDKVTADAVDEWFDDVRESFNTVITTPMQMLAAATVATSAATESKRHRRRGSGSSDNKKPHRGNGRGRTSGGGDNDEVGSCSGSGSGSGANHKAGDDEKANNPQYGLHPRPAENLKEDAPGSTAEHPKGTSPSAPTRESVLARLAAGRKDVAHSDESTGNQRPSSAGQDIDEGSVTEVAGVLKMSWTKIKKAVEKRGGDGVAIGSAAFLSGNW